MKIKLSSFVLLALFLLPAVNCRAQIAGNQTPEKNAIATGTISAIRGMNQSRAAHTATLLGDGKVLIAGGFAGDENSQASAEVFDPQTNRFSSAGNMSFARSGHSATVLPGGKVLIAGGYNGNYLDEAEIYDARTGRFTPTGKMTMPRSEHVAVLLANGKVLLAGGVGNGWTFLADAELYDPATGTFTKTKNAMRAARESHTAIRLKDGTILIAGGHQGRRAAMTVYQSAEVYDPANDAFTATGDLNVKRHKHGATRLDDGTILIVGGSDERDARGAYNSAEIYNPTTKTFAKISGEMNSARYKLQGTIVPLEDGKVLIAGGATQAEIYDPATKTFALTTGKFETARLFATATLLRDGRVLIVGGYDDSNRVSEAAWIYRS